MNTSTIAVVVAAVATVWFLVAQYNGLVRRNIAVTEAYAQIEVQLKRRADLIPNLVQTVKGYAAHEKATLDAVVAARAASQQAANLSSVAAADGQLTVALRGLFAVAEDYPDLKASANFIALQEELATTENKVGFARQYYNDAVSRLNQKAAAIPGRFFTGIADVRPREFYELDDPAARQAPTVAF